MIGSQVPRISSLPVAGDDRYGDAVSEFCASYGLILDEWQRFVLRHSLGKNGDKWAASRIALSVPRQSGKTALFEARELAGLVLFKDDELMIHSAHLYPTATEAFLRLKGYFENYDDLRKRVRHIRDWSGNQSIEMMDGRRLKFSARAGGQGRGFSCDTLLLDEAQDLSTEAWGDMLPSVSARRNPQIWLAGTPPSPKNNAEVFGRLRDSGIAGTDTRLAYFEWSAMKEMDPASVDTWALAIPALGGRVPVEVVEDEYNSMDPEQFARERLGIWDDNIHSQVVRQAAWRECAVSVSEVPTEGLVSYSVDMNPDRSMVSIGAARLRDDGSFHVECVENASTARGLDWVVDWLAERWSLASAVVIDGQSPIASILPELSARRVRTTVTGSGDMARACGMFVDAVHSGTMSHFDQPQLNAALAGAKKRPIGAAGAFGWDRKSLDMDITPLVVVTLASFGVKTSKRKPGRKSKVSF